MSEETGTPIWLVFHCERVSEDSDERTMLVRVSSTAPPQGETPPASLVTLAKALAHDDDGATLDHADLMVDDWFLVADTRTQRKLSLPGTHWPRTSRAFSALLAFYFSTEGEPEGHCAILRRAWTARDLDEDSLRNTFKRLFLRRGDPPDAWVKRVHPFAIVERDPDKLVTIAPDARQRIIVQPANELREIRRWILPLKPENPGTPLATSPSVSAHNSSLVQGAQAFGVGGSSGPAVTASPLAPPQPLHAPTKPRGATNAPVADILERLARAELRRRSAVYIRREREEKAILERVRAGDPWIPVEGEAGTGKTTLLEALIDPLTHGHERDGRWVPFFIDGSWLLSPIGATPLADHAEELGVVATSAWNLMRTLARRLFDEDARLVVLFDTLDAVLLSKQRGKAIRWFEELPNLGLQVVSCCRPLEARQARLPEPKVELLDFTDGQARQALSEYVQFFYRHEPAAVRQTLSDRLQRNYLQQASYADICRRPVTLRMLFEAYGDGFPPERLSRARLFRDFWDAKVHGPPGDVRGRGVPARDRERLATDLALAMSNAGKPRPAIPGAELDRIVVAAQLGKPAYDVLLSEGVLASAGAYPPTQVSFFHQSFLEYAAARAILRIVDPVLREQQVAELLHELRHPRGKPWFALLEELGVQAAGSPESEVVLTALASSDKTGALSSAAIVFCQLPAASVEAHRKLETRLAEDHVARHACLRHLHDAPPERLARLLDAFAAPAWRSGEEPARFAALEAWTKTAPLYPGPVRAQMEALGVFSDALADPGGHCLSRLGVALASFLGVDDTYAEERLAQLHAALLERPGGRSRVSLITAVGARTEVSTKAVALLERWMELEGAITAREIQQFREALGEALATTLPNHARVVHERVLVVGGGELGLRVLSVWRERIRRRVWTVHDLPLPLFAPSLDLPLARWAEVIEVLLRPLAESGHQGAIEGLIRTLRETPKAPAAERRDPVRDLVVRALLPAPMTEPDVRRLLEASGVLEAQPETLSTEEVRLLARGIVAVPDRATAILDGLERVGLLLQLLESIPSGHVAESVALRVLARTNELRGDDAGRLARHLERLLQAADRPASLDLLRATKTWFLALLRTSAWEPRKVALRALPLTLAGMDPVEVEALAIEIAAPWTRRKTDAEAHAIGDCLVQIAQRVRILDGAGLWKRALDVLLIGERSFEATRRTAYALLHELAARRRDDARAAIEQILGALEQGVIAGTNEIAGTIRLIHPVASADPIWAWSALVRAARVGRDAELGRHGWDSVKDAARRTIRVVLADAAARSRVCDDLPALPEHIQAAVVDCARATDDRVVFERLRKWERDGTLSRTARQKVHAWGRKPTPAS